MIILRTPKGWTGPKDVDGKPTEGSWRAAPGARSPTSAANPEHLAQLEAWLRSYRPDELFDDGGGTPPPTSPRCRPTGDRRMSANPHANGGLLLRDLRLPDFRDYGVEVPAPATTSSEATRVARDVPARRHRGATRRRSASSARTRRPPTGWTPSSR